jgi:8-hydroxy-5-deazaflavin:NADPH oxidoreductase
MRIGIIGAGHIGGTLARRFVELGHQVKIANSRGPQTLDDVAKETGATPVELRDAVRDVDVAVVTIPMKNVSQLPKDLFADGAPELTIIDTCNYYPKQRDGKIDEIENGRPESIYVQEQIGHPVVKAFNNIYAQNLGTLGKPAGTKHRIALPVAGDESTKVRVVAKLIDELGFDPVEYGDLNESWRQQPGQPCYARDYDEAGLRKALADAHKDRSPEWLAG